MSPQRIILINCSRLLGDLFQAVIRKTDSLEVVQVIDKSSTAFTTPPAAIEEAEWMVIFQRDRKDLPAWVDRYLAGHPSTRVLGIFLRSGKVKIKSLGSYEQEMDDLSLSDLIRILQSSPEQVWKVDFYPNLDLQRG